MTEPGPTQETFGVPQLDRLMGLVPRGARILLINDPGVEPAPFLRQVVRIRRRAGQTIVAAAMTRTPHRTLEHLGLTQTDIEQGRAVVVDAYSGLMGLGSDSKYLVPSPDDLLSVAGTLAKAARAHRGATLILDDVSAWLDRFEPATVTRHMPSLEGAFAGYESTFAPFTRWPYGGEDDAFIARFDAVVRLKAVEDRVVFSQYFNVDHTRWNAHVDTRPRLYKVVEHGGVLVYIPKIVITGPHNAGKSSFIRSASDQATSADRLGTTVALDHGHLEIDGLSVDLFGTPGQARFDPIIRTVANQALGVILVIDSTQPETFARAHEMLRLTWQMGLPAVVAANKQDVPGAMSVADVAKQLDMPATVPIVPCSAIDKTAVVGVLRTLLDRIMADAPGGHAIATGGDA